MANTKVSALTGISGGTLAASDSFPVADVSDLSVTFRATAANIKTFCTTAPVFAAGTSSAGTWPTFTSGTLLTTAEAGAIELDSSCFYGTTDAGNRGYIPVRHFIRCDSTKTLTNTTSEQQLFDSPANGRLTLETGCYRFQAILYITSMDAANATNAAIDPVGGGTAVTGSWLWHAQGIDQATPTNAQTASGSFSISQQSVASVIGGIMAGAMAVRIKGTFEVTTGGTMIPSITLATGAAAVVAVGSFFAFERMGSTSVASVGEWD